MKIGVLFGGISPERNVSITGGKAVIEALMELGHDVVGIDPALGKDCVIKKENIIISEKYPTKEELSKYPLRNYIAAVNSEVFDDIEVAFLVLHGENGEDGKIQSLLELRGIPYTGSDVKASSLAIDKNSSKMIFSASGIATPPWISLRKKDFDNYDLLKEIRSEFGNHLVIKPNNQGSTIGVTMIDNGNLDDINEGILKASEYSEIVLIERFIEGSEITVGIVGDAALPVIEIVPESGFYDYNHKYTKGHTEYICPAEISEDITEFAQSLAVSAFQAIGCKGFARADFRLNEDGQLFLLEINTIPGFTSTSLVPMAAKELGYEFPELCQMIIDLALEKNNH